MHAVMSRQPWILSSFSEEERGPLRFDEVRLVGRIPAGCATRCEYKVVAAQEYVASSAARRPAVLTHERTGSECGNNVLRRQLRVFMLGLVHRAYTGVVVVMHHARGTLPKEFR
jgi:hypothetical protein